MSTEKLGKSGLGVLWNKIISVLSNKVDKEKGKGLSTNDYTNDEKNKLANISEGASKSYYAVCNSTGSDANKVATCYIDTLGNTDTSFELKLGVEVNVIFADSNTYNGDTMTLNVNSTGDIEIFTLNSTYTNHHYRNEFIQYNMYKFIYNGRWCCIGLIGDLKDVTGASKFDKDSTAYLSERSIYYGTPTINDSKNYTSDSKIYAPISKGDSRQLLRSSGTGAPVWENYIEVYAGNDTDSITDSGIYDIDTDVCANAPVVDGHCTLFVANNDTGIRQVAIMQGNEIYSRIYNGTEWLDWIKLTILGTSSYYGTCDGYATYSDRDVTCNDKTFKLEIGVEITVYFTYPTICSTLNLNVNNTGSKPVIFPGVHGGVTDAEHKIREYSVCKFVYDGTNWRLIGNDIRDITDSASGTTLGESDTSLVTGRSVYYGTPTINGSHDYTSDTNLYAPTEVGTSGQVLTSNGSGAPVWADSSSGSKSSFYATCSSTSSVTAKIATCDDTSFKLEKGVEVNVYFTYANTVSSTLTLNVNSTGAKTIYFIGGSTNGYYKIRSASICKFIYDGTYWRVVGNSPRGETDSTSAASLSTNPYYVTERDVYYGLPKINGTKSYNSNTSIYAPTSVGSSGQVLTSSGSGTPTWKDPISGSSTTIFEGLMSSTTTLYNLTKHSTSDSLFSFYVVLRITGFGNNNYRYSKGFVTDLCIYYRTDTTCDGSGGTVKLEDEYNSGNYIKLTVQPNTCASSNGDIPQLKLDFTNASTMRIFKIESL